MLVPKPGSCPFNSKWPGRISQIEGETEGYSVVFDYRRNPEPRIETDTLDGYSIRSYVIPVLQETP